MNFYDPDSYKNLMRIAAARISQEGAQAFHDRCQGAPSKPILVVETVNKALEWDFWIGDDGRPYARMRGKNDQSLALFDLMLKDNGLPVPAITSHDLNEIQVEHYRKLAQIGRPELGTRDVKNAFLNSRNSSTGKTTVALMAAKHLRARGITCLAMTAATLKARFEASQMQLLKESLESTLRQFREPGLLVIDDLGTGVLQRDAASDHEIQTITQVLSGREALDKATWITSNYTPEDLLKMYGQSAFSRLMRKGRSLNLDFNGVPNFRV